MFKRLIASIICVTFSLSNIQYVHAQDFSVNQLPVPGTMVGESAPFAPLALKGLIVNPQKPLEFQFIVDTGKGPQDTASIKEEANQLVKYFLAGLTIPEGDLWVNLSPYEKNRMVPTALGQTDLGRDLLAQDYILKQLTASLIYPEKDLGKEFWSRVYAKAQAQFGTTNVPVNTFNKVWILPDQAQVYENVNAAYVTKSTLKVMLDEDYTALQKHLLVHNSTDAIGSQIVREIVLPEITKEVNTGKNFAPLRQIYQALILAKWYKETIQNGLLDALYTNKNKVAGVNLNDPTVKEQIYNRYLQAYKKGAFNYIKEDPTPDGQVVPRKYFSGGTSMAMIVDNHGTPAMVHTDGAMISFRVILSKLTTPILTVPALKRLISANPEIVSRILKEFTGPEPEGDPSKQRIKGEIIELMRKVIYSRTDPRRITTKIGYGAIKDALRYWSKGGDFVVVPRYPFLDFDTPAPIEIQPDEAWKARKAEETRRAEEAWDKQMSEHPDIIRKLEAEVHSDKDNRQQRLKMLFQMALETGVIENRPANEIAVLMESAEGKYYYELYNILSDMLNALSDDRGNYRYVDHGKYGFKYGSNHYVDFRYDSSRLHHYGDTYEYTDRDGDTHELERVWRSDWIKEKRNPAMSTPIQNEQKDAAMLFAKTRLNWILNHNTGEQLMEKIKKVLKNVDTEKELINLIVIIGESRKPEAIKPITDVIKSWKSYELLNVAAESLKELGMESGQVDRFISEEREAINKYYENNSRFSAGSTTAYGDYAMHTSVNSKNLKDLGGIDLNQINVLRGGKTVNVQFDPAQLTQLEQGGFEGFTPVIINITHISSPFQLLGINPAKQEVLAKA